MTTIARLRGLPAFCEQPYRSCSRNGHRILYGDDILAPTHVCVKDPCLLALLEISTVAHVLVDLHQHLAFGFWEFLTSGFGARN